MEEEDIMPLIAKIIFGFVMVILLLTLTVKIVGPGERGILLTWGAVNKNVLDEGIHFVIPIAQTVDILSVRTLKEEAKAEAASSDLQIVNTTVALNYHLRPDKVSEIYQKVGKDYVVRIIDPAIQETVKAATANFKAEELITQRPLVKQKIDEAILERLEQYNIVVETISITDFKFSEEFNKSIEQKVVAQQLKLKSEFDLERIKIEALQAAAKAEGDANAIEIINRQLIKSPQYITYLATQKWDGKLPLATGGVLPFIQISSDMNK